ncbi:MAG: hypothetical protein NTY53_18425, partial [Kiritimatiellaeota bacterium]|nr:hypothetical protein [Kiritimatiellota bacterium]
RPSAAIRILFIENISAQARRFYGAPDGGQAETTAARARRIFQGLETVTAVFPEVGKPHQQFPKPWKNNAHIFQGLENGL